MALANNCQDCKFFLNTAKTPSHPNGLNVCRRYPPTMCLDPERQAWMTSFPILGNPADTWCGEHLKKIVLAS